MSATIYQVKFNYIDPNYKMLVYDKRTVAASTKEEALRKVTKHYPFPIGIMYVESLQEAANG